MSIISHQLSTLYRRSHDQMRNVDGLQPQEAFDELLKYLFLKQSADERGLQLPHFTTPILNQDIVSLNHELSKALRRNLKIFLSETDSWSVELWKDKSFRLSDVALLGVHELFEPIDFSTVNIDTRSAALNEFIPGELRKGLGIFPTPDGVARMIVEVASPHATSRVFDPACGTGTFLVEVIRQGTNSRSGQIARRVWGVDKSPRMLLLSELNLGHTTNVDYRRSLADSLYQDPTTLFSEVNDGFDFVLTNPPFGVVVDRNKNDLRSFLTCRTPAGDIVKRQQSEVVFAEQCLKYLKPGGLLAIVLPRSVATNSSLRNARQAINSLGYLEAIVNLPSETFSVSGTQTNTVVLFLRRYKSPSERTEPITVVSVTVDNVGFDSTGRSRVGNQLADVPTALQEARKGKAIAPFVRVLPKITKQSSITDLPDLLAGRTTTPDHKNSASLSELVEFATNGRTPARANYSDAGLFLVKVGNLTGRGIDWQARDRNFISDSDMGDRATNTRLILRRGDILLTSSAHAPVYIAKKVDIVSTIPKQIGGKASYVGEVMMLRARPGVDPYTLVGYLRLPSTQQQIRSMVRGQTAHLHPKDVLALRLPRILVNPPPEFQRLAERIKKECQLSDELNELVFEQRQASAAAELALMS